MLHDSGLLLSWRCWPADGHLSPPKLSEAQQDRLHAAGHILSSRWSCFRDLPPFSQVAIGYLAAPPLHYGFLMQGAANGRQSSVAGGVGGGDLVLLLQKDPEV